METHFQPHDKLGIIIVVALLLGLLITLLSMAMRERTPFIPGEQMPPRLVLLHARNNTNYGVLRFMIAMLAGFTVFAIPFTMIIMPMFILGLGISGLSILFGLFLLRTVLDIADVLIFQTSLKTMETLKTETQQS